MSKMNNGGSAFPQHSSSQVDNGMSLRDYFAGQAMIGILSSGFEWDKVKSLAGRSYAIADAMLQEREKEKGEDDE